MRRLVIVVIGLLLAFLASCCFLATALLFESLAIPADTGLALFRVVAFLAAMLADRDPAGFARDIAAALWMMVMTLCIAPVSLVAVLGEVAGLRAAAWYAGATGAVTAALPTALHAARDLPVKTAGALDARATLVLFLTGLAGGAVYWFVAGRGAARPGNLR